MNEWLREGYDLMSKPLGTIESEVLKVYDKDSPYLATNKIENHLLKELKYNI